MRKTPAATASAILSNTAGSSGGGIYNLGGTVTAVNSTLSGNRANDDGGGIRNTSSGIVTLSNVTITNNTADADASGEGNGGGITARSSGTVTTLRNSILAGNQDNSPTSKRPDCYSVVTSQGYNILGNNTGCVYTSSTGDQVGTGSNPINPQLGPLQNNGGPTLTHALLTGSPAIDAGNPATPGSGANACEASDQRLYGRPADGDNNGSARCDIGAYEVGATPATLITYTYDPLYRLTAANYSTGLAFAYTYDAVGNRLTQFSASGTVTYTYDSANRLINVGGAAQTWDANGNLLNDGVYTYTYDVANRLIGASGQSSVFSYQYNGLGDRMRQVVNSITTTYTLDLNAGLTQVLADGTNTYLYGNGRIAQYTGTTPAYFLGDALGSVRQLANASGAVTLARSYEPFGNTLSSAGSGTTVFQFTGEIRDGTGLTYLRARYLSTQIGRFITRDIWPGDNQRPMSFNAWLYVYANPINLTDPTGMFPEWCRKASSARLYELCVRSYYNLDPPNDANAVSEVSGGPGCFSGPVPYRAPGYLEGIGGVIPFSVVGIGTEIVYDFATLERQRFSYAGVNVTDSILGVTGAQYSGVVFGFRSWRGRDITSDYTGPFWVFTLGGGTDFGPQPIGVGTGGVLFVGVTDTSIWGMAWYIGVSISVDLIPGVDVGGGFLVYAAIDQKVSYVNADGKTVNTSKLFSDIWSGNGTPWISDFPPHAQASRALALLQAWRYAMVYEDMRSP